jgi:predicted transcriptional regulator
MAKPIFEIAAEVVQAQASTSSLSAFEIVSSLKLVFNTLREMQRSETNGSGPEVHPAPAPEQPEFVPAEVKASAKPINPQDSIREDVIICLECGVEMRQLTSKHLASHELNPREYKKKYGFQMTQSLSAKSLSKARSKAAKKRGLPENLRKFQDDRRKKKQSA